MGNVSQRGSSSKQWVSYIEASRVLGVSVATFYRMVAQHAFETCHKGKGKLWNLDELLEYQKHTQKPEVPDPLGFAHTPSELAKIEFYEAHGLLPFECPDRIEEWCALLNKHRQKDAAQVLMFIPRHPISLHAAV